MSILTLSANETGLKEIYRTLASLKDSTVFLILHACTERIDLHVTLV